ncbi:MAG: YSC84-related protein [Azonexus sp.]|nr:YSC84-related protein [Azonexus sp.]MDZ4313472.1 YSC84-related protein [Azonexus sp.]
MRLFLRALPHQPNLQSSPNILKAGLVFGGSYGEGVLLKNQQNQGYYNSASASWGWQAGAESYSYVVFLMSDKAVKYLDKSKGWEFGVGPTVVAVNEGIAKNLSTSTLKNDAYAFIFDQQGLIGELEHRRDKDFPHQALISLNALIRSLRACLAA